MSCDVPCAVSCTVFKCSSISTLPWNRKENLKYQHITRLFIRVLRTMISRSTITRTVFVSEIFPGELFVAFSLLFRFTDISLNFVSRTLRRLFLFKHSKITYPVSRYSCRKSTISLVSVRTTLSCTSWNDVSCYSVDGKQNITPNGYC